MSAPATAAPVPPPAPRGSWRQRLLWAPLLFLLAAFLYWPTLGNEYAYDDIDYLNQAADVMAGKSGFWETLLRPQGEHLVAGMRLVLYVCARLFGADALPFRGLVLLAHVTAALALATIARRYAGPAAGVAAAVAYVLPCGFSSMWLWFPSGGSLPFGLGLLLAGCAALVHREALGVTRARLLAAAGLVLALLCESTLAPLAALPALLDERARWRAGRRRPGGFALACLAIAVLAGGLTSWLYTRTFGPRVSINLVAGLPRAVFLLAVAPFRYFFPGIPVLGSSPGLPTALLGAVLGLAVAAPIAALLYALWRERRPPLLAVAALAAVGPAGMVLLVGVGRWRTTFWELYDADRYFFTLLIPASLLVGAAAATARERLAGWSRRQRAALASLLALGLLAEGVLHRRAALRRVPYDVYAAHEHRFAQLGRLAERLSAAALALPPGSPPLEFPDARLWLPNVHNGYLSSRFLLHVIGHRAGDRLRLGGDRVAARDEAILDPLLEEWARAEGEPLPYLSIADGRLVDAHLVSLVDFRAGPQEGAVVSGFYDWEGSSRWMGRRGELRLTLTGPSLVFLLAAPVDALQAKGVAAVAVQVSVVDEGTGWATPLGELRLEQPGMGLHRLDATPFLSRLGNGRAVHLILEADRTWKPSEVLPAAIDTRDLSVMVFAAGCEG